MFLSLMADQELILLGVIFFIVVYVLVFSHEYLKYYRPALKNKAKGKVVPINKYNDNNDYNDIW